MVYQNGLDQFFPTVFSISASKPFSACDPLLLTNSFLILLSRSNH